MKFKPTDRVVHLSDKSPRKMVVAAICEGKIPPENQFNEMVNSGAIPDGTYYCTWISGKNKGEGYFLESELEFQDP